MIYDPQIREALTYCLIVTEGPGLLIFRYYPSVFVFMINRFLEFLFANQIIVKVQL